MTNLDDNVTQSAIRVLMRLDRALGFQDAAIHGAVTFALDKLIDAQYPIGAWPQRFAAAPDHAKFPVTRASYPETWDRTWPGPVYQQHYTFNDNSISDVIDVMLEAARIYREPRYLASAEKGGQFILLAQMPEPQPAWAQQYDADMHPAWARVFEPPSVTGGESQGIMRTLMVLYRETGDPKYLEPIPRALAYLKRSILPPADHAVEARQRIDGPALARFYELRTNRPLYITKGTRMIAAGLGSRLVDGYELSYDDHSVITHYGVLVSGAGLDAIAQDHAALLAMDRESRRRPDRLTGLSPWSERPRASPAPDALAAAARELIGSMDARGAWLTEGTIGKADRLVFLYAARDMVLRIGRGRSDGSAGGTVGAAGASVGAPPEAPVPMAATPIGSSASVRTTPSRSSRATSRRASASSARRSSHGTCRPSPTTIARADGFDGRAGSPSRPPSRYPSGPWCQRHHVVLQQHRASPGIDAMRPECEPRECPGRNQRDA